ncbi:hypothetical protein HZH68_000612 [Vespula germanica]|uniref:Uncharacterized protein n=1 Tax=Vespula germanica TaxID=30212 RepID=A0A834NTX3_VESGE|nr:hypothetical protein HZH68_000612 [Vespula germanica]
MSNIAEGLDDETLPCLSSVQLSHMLRADLQPDLAWSTLLAMELIKRGQAICSCVAEYELEDPVVNIGKWELLAKQ